MTPRLHRIEHISAIVERNQPALLHVRNMESGVRHTERIEDARFQEGLEGLARDDLHDAAEHVGCHRIFPGRAGMIRQRQIGELVDHISERRQRIEHARFVIAFEQHGAGIENAVAETGSVGQKLADRDRAFRRLDVGKARSALLQHLAIAELRQECLDRVIEPIRPPSTRSMMAQVTKILVLENARKIWSGRSAVFASRSAKPTHCWSTTSRPRSTAQDAPGMIS